MDSIFQMLEDAMAAEAASVAPADRADVIERMVLNAVERIHDIGFVLQNGPNVLGG